jgi:hypothetical protein
MSRALLLDSFLAGFALAAGGWGAVYLLLLRRARVRRRINAGLRQANLAAEAATVTAQADAAAAWRAMVRLMVQRLGYDPRAAEDAVRVWRDHGYGKASIAGIAIDQASPVFASTLSRFRREPGGIYKPAVHFRVEREQARRAAKRLRRKAARSRID